MTGRRSHGVWPVQWSHSFYLEHVEDEGAAVVQIVDHLEVIDVAVHGVGQLKRTKTR